MANCIHRKLLNDVTSMHCLKMMKSSSSGGSIARLTTQCLKSTAILLMGQKKEMTMIKYGVIVVAIIHIYTCIYILDRLIIKKLKRNYHPVKPCYLPMNYLLQ